MSSMYPNPDGALVLREKYRYGSEVAHRATFGDNVPEMIRTHTEIEPEPIRTNLIHALTNGIINSPNGTPVEFGWSTYTLEIAP